MSTALAQIVAQAQGYRPTLAAVSAYDLRRKMLDDRIRHEVLRVLSNEFEPAKRIAARIGRDPNRVRAVLLQMAQAGEIRTQNSVGANNKAFEGFARLEGGKA